MTVTNRPLLDSTVFGVAAVILGLLPAIVLAALRRSVFLAVNLSGHGEAVTPIRDVMVPGTVMLGEWLWYNAHFVQMRLPEAGLTSVTSLNLLNAVGGVALLLFLVPPLALVAAGYAFVRLSGVPLSMAHFGGASIVVGYAPATVLTALLIATPTGYGTAVSPDLIPAVLVAVVYPILFGALGGTLAEKHIRGLGASDDPANTANESA